MLTKNYSDLLFQLVQENRVSLENYSSHQESMIEAIASHSLIHNSTDLIGQIISGSKRVLQESFILNEIILTTALVNSENNLGETGGTKISNDLSLSETKGNSVYRNGNTDVLQSQPSIAEKIDEDLLEKLMNKGNQASTPQHFNKEEFLNGQRNVLKNPLIITAEKNTTGILEDWLKEQIAELIGLDKVLIISDVDLEGELGMDSLRIVELWSKLSKEFPQYKPYRDAIYNASTIQHLVDYLEGKVAEKEKEEISTVQESWIVLQLAEMLGVPKSMINQESLLEDELGLDSLRIIELHEIISQKYPARKISKANLLHIQTVKDLEDLVLDHKDVVDLHGFTSHIYGLLKKHAGDSLEINEGYYKTKKINAFQVAYAITNAIKAYPHLSHLERTLISCQSIKEIDEIVTKSPKGKVADYVENEGLQRIVWRQRQKLIEIPRLVKEDKVLILVQANDKEKWEQFFVDTARTEFVMIGEEFWQFKSEKYRISVDNSVDRLLYDLTFENYALIVFIAGSGDPEENGFAASGLQLLKFVQSIAKFDASLKEKLNLTVIMEESSLLRGVSGRGVAKALSKEWTKAKVRTICFDSDFTFWTPKSLLQVFQNAPCENDLVIKKGSVYSSDLIPAHIPVALQSKGFEVKENDVILLLGGASGITAEITKVLSSKYKCHFVCMGRTEQPAEEPFPLISPDDLSIKDVMEEEYILPKKLQDKLKKVRRQKAIFNMEKIVTSQNGHFHYISGDASKEEDIKRVLDYCRSQGSVVGVIHGSGFASDTMVERKNEDEFLGVFDAKAKAGWHLYNQLKPSDTPKFVFFMSSLSSVYGIEGQADYVAANDFLNELACKWNKEVSARVKSLLWGVWSESGFVKDSTSSLNLFHSIGLQGIKNKEGADAVCLELDYADKEDTTIILTTASCLKYAQDPASFQSANL